MPGVPLSEMTDLLKATTERLPLKFELPLTYSQYPFCTMFLSESKRVIRGGTRIVEHVQIDRGGNAAHVLPYETETASVAQHMGQIKAEFVTARTKWTIEEGEEALNRSGSDAASFARLLYTLAESREADAKIDMADLLEQAPWQVPATDTDNQTPLGIPYWVPKLESGQAATAAGWYGGVYSSDFSNVAGISPAASGDNTTAITGGKPLWRSWQAGYGTAINDAWDKQMSRTHLKLNFQAPSIVTSLGGSTEIAEGFGPFRLFANGDTIIDIEQWQRKQNDQVGSNVGKFRGAVTFKSIPFHYAPVLDDTSSGAAGQYNPIYFINLDKFKVYVQDGWYFTRKQPPVNTLQPLVHTVFIYLKYCLMCKNRRMQGVVNQVA